MVANPHKGEVSLEIGGTSYTLKFSTNALCVAEKVSGQKISALMDDLGEGSLNAVRALFTAAMAKHMPNMTVEQAGDLLDEATVPVVTAKLTEALMIAFPTAKADTANPTKPEQAGTG